MKKVIAGLVVAMGMSSAAFAAGNVAAGQEKAMMCGGCHGMDGNSMMANFPKLANIGEKYMVKQMQDIKSGARAVPEMTGLLDAMSDQDLQDMAAFFASQKRGVNQASAEGIEKGQQLYRAGNKATGAAACTACHGPTGAGIELAAFPALGGQHAAYIEKQLQMFRSGDRNNDGDAAIMRSIAAKLSDAEIKAVANYISGLN